MTPALPKGVLWDMDGTLVDSNALHFGAWQTVLRTAGYDFTQEDHTATQGLRNDAILRLIIPTLVRDEAQRLEAAKEHHYRTEVAQVGLEPLPGVRLWLERLKAAGWRMAVASSGPHANIAAVLAVTGLQPLFERVVSGDDVHQSKPDPAIFALAAEQLDVAPERCVVVEDALPGVEAGHRAGMRVIGVGPRCHNLGADLAVTHVDQLPADAFARLIKGENPR